MVMASNVGKQKKGNWPHALGAKCLEWMAPLNNSFLAQE